MNSLAAARSCGPLLEGSIQGNEANPFQIAENNRSSCASPAPTPTAPPRPGSVDFAESIFQEFEGAGPCKFLALQSLEIGMGAEV